MELHPFISKIKSGIAIRRLPEKRSGFCGLVPVRAIQRNIGRRRIEGRATVQVFCGQFKAEPHETARGVAPVVGRVSVLKKAVFEIVIVNRGELHLRREH